MNCHVCEYTYEYDSVRLFVCPRCGHGFRAFEGDPLHYHMNEYRSLFRRNQNEFDGNGKPNKLFHKSRKGIVRKRKALVKKYLDKNDHCLDIGSGGGTFCREIMKLVKSLECIEVSHQLVEECRRLGFVTYSNDFLNHEFNKTYDIVFAWHVLEHIKELKAFVHKALTLARKYFILEIPYQRGVPDTFDGHYHYFSMTSLRFLLGEKRILDMSAGVQNPALFAVVRGYLG